MNLTKKHKILLFVLIVGVVLYFSSQYIINVAINKFLPIAIKEKNDSPYNLTYATAEYSLIARKLSIKGIAVEPKEESYKKTTTYIESVIEELEIQQVAIWHLIKSKELVAKGISLTNPNVQIYKQAHSLDQLPHKHHNFLKNINLNEIELKGAFLTLFKADNKVKLHEIHNLNAVIKGVSFGKQTNSKLIPFQYEDYHISCDSTFNNLNNLHYLKTGTATIYKKDITINELVVEPKHNNDKKTIHPKKLVTIVIPQIQLIGTDWGYKNEKDFYVNIDTITTSQIDLNITANKKFISSGHQKESYVKLLPINLKIGTIDFKGIKVNTDNEWILEKGDILLSNINNNKKNNLNISNIKLINPNIGSFELKNALFSSYEESAKTPKIELKQINTTLSNIEISKNTVSKKIPFSYKKITTDIEDIKINTNPLYTIAVKKLNANNKSISINNLDITPKYSRQKTVSMFTYANDIYTVAAKKIELDNYQWGFDSDNVFYLNVSNTIIDQLNANIFRDKTPNIDPAVKSLFSKKLRELTFGLTLAQIKLKNSIIEYEETDKNAISPGKLTFANFNATIKNINSGYRQQALPTTIISVDASFMNAAPLHVDWTFNILNPSDEFAINGTIKNFPADAMQPFLQPYIKASTEGTIKLVSFSFTGDNSIARGKFGMNYDDLKVILYHKNGKQERRFLSKLGNLLIHKNSEGTLKDVHIKKVHRVEDKSFFNYLWLCILQGLKQTIL